MRDFWQKAESPDGVASAVQIFHDERKRDPNAIVFPETALNLLGYQLLQEGKTKQAIELFKLNTEAYPTSANTYDSLGDAYLADGQNDLALQGVAKGDRDAGRRQGERRSKAGDSRERRRQDRQAQGNQQQIAAGHDHSTANA